MNNSRNRLVVSESAVAPFRYHLREVTPGKAPNYGGLARGEDIALCGVRLSWDVHIPLSQWKKGRRRLVCWCPNCREDVHSHDSTDRLRELANSLLARARIEPGLPTDGEDSAVAHLPETWQAVVETDLMVHLLSSLFGIGPVNDLSMARVFGAVAPIAEFLGLHTKQASFLAYRLINEWVHETAHWRRKDGEDPDESLDTCLCSYTEDEFNDLCDAFVSKTEDEGG